MRELLEVAPVVLLGGHPEPVWTEQSARRHPEKVIEVLPLDEEPIVLPAWDPMGALAE